MFFKKGSKFSQTIKKKPAAESIFNNVTGLQAATLLKNNSGTGIFGDFCEIS